ncbi:MAG: aldo/keto reductase [Spirochaetales bacterium]|nr:aldo/keto reductase [Spirochaetales bacterium]MCF7938090.1 aldo/keto reductase [Spirochaetales bacterium]
MTYKKYGQTGKMVSAVGFGAMRFEHPEQVEESAETVLHAFEKGINYFDTAPGYFKGKSEEAVGLAVKEMKKRGGPFYLSTKSMKKKASDLRRDLEKSLERLGVDSIDFFHCWYILSVEDWESRKTGGAVDEIMRAKEEGLIKHAAFSTHMPGDDIMKVLDEDIFEGVTLGYSVINFPYREAGLKAAAKKDMGVVVMNPLAGGVIPRNPESFSFIKRKPEQSVVEAALHFLFSHDEITMPLVGFRNKSDVDDAVRALETFQPYQTGEIEVIKERVEEEFNNLCTTCRYCDVCPVDIDVWRFMETANLLYLKGEESLTERLRGHWGTSIDELDRCIQCGDCEAACTQHIPILDRFEELKEAIRKENA